MKRFLFLLRKNFIIVFTMSFYILSVYFFFFDGKMLFGLLFAILFFLLAHYFLIEIKKIQITNLLFIIGVITLFLLLISGFNNFFYVLGIILFNVGVFFLFWTIYDEIYNRIQISSYNIFTRGTKIYAIFLSITFAVVFLGTYRTFDLTCGQISSFTSKVAQHVLTNFGFNTQNINNVKLKDIADYIGKNKSNDKLLTGENIISTGENIITNGENITFGSLVSISFWKNVILNQILQNKKLLNKSICEIIVGKIKSEYQKTKFQFTVMFLLFMLFYPIIGLFLFVLSFINFIFFKLINLFKIYKFKTIVEDVEIIE